MPASRFPRVLLTAGAVGSFTLLAACGGSSAASGGGVVVIEPGAAAPEKIQEALIRAEPGSVVRLAAGRYRLPTPLSCGVEKVTLQGEGQDRTVLSFAGQKQGGEGLLVSAGGFRLENLAIEDTAGDGLKVTGADVVVVRGVRVEWTRGPHRDNGGYGIYPIQCRHVLVEDCIAIGASDAGIYVGQSEDIVVRRNEVRQNVVGIEIENSRRADVYDNVAHDNAGGIMVFDLPTTPRRNGGQVRVFDNECRGNDHDNFAPKGNIVSIVPSGTGMLVMANDSVEIFRNHIADHRTVNFTICSYRLTASATEAAPQATWDDAYEPDAEAVFVHDNRFGDCGDAPRGSLGRQLEQMLGLPIPDIVYDGFTDPRKLVNGSLPERLGVWFGDNGDAGFACLRLGSKAGPVRDIAAYRGALPPLPPVALPRGVE